MQSIISLEYLAQIKRPKVTENIANIGKVVVIKIEDEVLWLKISLIKVGIQVVIPSLSIPCIIIENSKGSKPKDFIKVNKETLFLEYSFVPFSFIFKIWISLTFLVQIMEIVKAKIAQNKNMYVYEQYVKDMGMNRNKKIVAKEENIITILHEFLYSSGVSRLNIIFTNGGQSKDCAKPLIVHKTEMSRILLVKNKLMLMQPVMQSPIVIIFLGLKVSPKEPEINCPIP